MTDETRGAEALADLGSETIAEGAGSLHPWPRSVIHFCGGLLTAACLAWALSVPQYVGYAFYTEQLLALVLGLALCVCYHALNWHGKRQTGLPLFDMLLGYIGLITLLWVMSQYPRLLLDVAFRTPEVLVISAIIILLCLEGLRRATGWALLIVVACFFAYAFVAHLAPVELRGRPVQPGPLAVYLGFDPSALFGTPLVVGSTIVLMFLWMGDVLIRAGGGEFFKDIAMAFLGHKRGGPAKICVVGSALFGMISGSAVSNVASVGVFTIPLMKRTGYSPQVAGAIEAVGSTGGQLMPPVMGASAFLMAEFIEMPYAEVALSAAIPAALYYLALYWQVDLIAGKQRLARLHEALPEVGTVLKEGWHLILPFAFLIYAMFSWEQSPEVAAIGATLMIFAVSLFRSYKGKRIRPLDFFASLSSTGRTTTDLIMTLAAAGFIIGILNITGLGFALTLWLVKMSGSSLYLLLVIAFGVSLVLGMGMPTTAVYVLLAALVAPSIVQALGHAFGAAATAHPAVTKMSAHMFILYGGMLSMITPPVALAAYAAANISGAGPMETGWWACRIGWAKFILPFMFVLSPTLLMIGKPTAIVYDAVTAFLGVYIATVGIVGYFQREIGPVLRVVMIVAGAAAIIPDSAIGLAVPGLLSGLGVLVGCSVLAVEYVSHRRTSLARGAVE
jgi:TRAP transporter 4TM/12TM fusion protein